MSLSTDYCRKQAVIEAIATADQMDNGDMVYQLAAIHPRIGKLFADYSALAASCKSRSFDEINAAQSEHQAACHKLLCELQMITDRAHAARDEAEQATK